MQNPSHGVAQPLQNHVHLISGFRFPLIASVNLEQAFKYLIDAPQIVKALAPMSWTYVQAPQDGTLWLEWLTPDKNEGRFPSDGYVWGDTEATYRQEFGGYTVEMMVHTVGYRMQYDHMASHARTRYHLVAKNPSVNAAPPDPSLWIVHYHHAEHTRILPSNQVPFTPQSQQIMNERRWLESQGALEKKDFMLHDRSSWPMIDVPRKAGSMQARQMQHMGNYGASATVQQQQHSRYPPYYPQQGGGQAAPQAKRQKMNAPMAGGVAATEVVHDMSIEDEENTTLGDFFDHLTPRDISMTRYMQHHRWMEEVFSSPYASAQIVPADLGMGLMGGLKGLTEGIMEPPSLDFASEKLQTPKAKEAQPFTNLKKDQIDEFNKRVERHLEEGQAEIKRMKLEHAKKMAEWRKSSKVMLAEKRLRYATWEGHEGAVPAFRFEEHGHAEEGAKESISDVVKEVEGLMGVKISAHKEADMVEKGGLEKAEEAAPPREQQVMQSMAAQQQPRTAFAASAAQAGSMSAAPPQTYHSDPLPPVSKPQVALPQQQQQLLQPQGTIAQQQASLVGTSSLTMPLGETSMLEEGMDLDDNTNNNSNGSNFDFAGDEQLGTPSGDVIDNEATASTAMQQHHHQHQSSAAQPISGMPTTLSGQTQILAPSQGVGDGEGVGGDAMNSMFDNSAFDDFTNMDDAGGDGLMFEGGAGDLGDDMFGEALHGMDESDGGQEGGVGSGEGDEEGGQ